MAIAVALIVSVLVASILYLLGQRSGKRRLDILVTTCTIFGALSGGLTFYLWEHPAPPSPNPAPLTVGTATTSGNSGPLVIGSGTSQQVISSGVGSVAVGGNVGSMSVTVDGSALPKNEGEKRKK